MTYPIEQKKNKNRPFGTVFILAYGVLHKVVIKC